MNGEQTKRAIEHLKEFYLTASQVLEVEEARYNNACVDIAIQTLQAELDRMENKPLTLSELAKEYIKKPVWVSCEEEWKVIDSISFSVIGDIENYIEFTDGSELEYTESDFYKHKPTE